MHNQQLGKSRPAPKIIEQAVNNPGISVPIAVASFLPGVGLVTIPAFSIISLLQENSREHKEATVKWEANKQVGLEAENATKSLQGSILQLKGDIPPEKLLES